MGDLTKKEQGRINAALTQSCLEMFDTKEKNLSKKEKMCEIMSRCTNDTKNILDIFLCGSNTPKSFKRLFKGIDSNGIDTIAEICNESNSDTKKKVTIKTIFGGSERIPFRGLVYLLPVMKLCEELENTDANIDVNIEFLFMNQSAIILNSFDPDKTNKTAIQFIEIAKKYIDEFHPKMADKVGFYIDRTYTSAIMDTKEYKMILNALEKALTQNPNIAQKLNEMGEKRNSAINSSKYAALHTFTQDGYVDPKVATMHEFFSKKKIEEADYIISIGAAPEEKFYKIRKFVEDKIKHVDFFKPKKSIQYIANVNVPPYYVLPEGELLMEDGLENPQIILDARLRDKHSKELSKYNVPVQKAVELLLEDTESSKSDKSLVEFMEGVSKEIKENKREEK